MPADDPIVQRLKAEGQLTRNSGTNSIKSVKQRLEKFQTIFDSMNTQLIEQTKILQEILKVQTETFDREKRREELTKVEPTLVQTPSNNTNVLSDNANTKQGLSNENTLFGAFGSFLAGAIGGITAASSLSFFKGLGLRIIQGGLIILLAKPLGEWIGKLTELALTDLTISTDLAKNFGSALDGAIQWGLIGSAIGMILGKKFRTWFAIGAVASGVNWGYQKIEELIGFKEGEIAQAFSDALGIDTEWIDTIGTALAIGVSALLVRFVPGMIGSILGLATTALAAGKGIGQFVLKNPAAIIASSLILFGEDLSKWLKNQLGIEEDGTISAGMDVLLTSAQFAALGAMFGPQGALIGAAVGLALGLGGKIYDWLIEQRENATREMQERLEAARNLLKDATPEQLKEIEEISTLSGEELRNKLDRGELPIDPTVSQAANLITGQKIVDFDTMFAQLIDALGGSFQPGFDKETFRSMIDKSREEKEKFIADFIGSHGELDDTNMDLLRSLLEVNAAPLRIDISGADRISALAQQILEDHAIHLSDTATEEEKRSARQRMIDAHNEIKRIRGETGLPQGFGDTIMSPGGHKYDTLGSISPITSRLLESMNFISENARTASNVVLNNMPVTNITGGTTVTQGGTTNIGGSNSTSVIMTGGSSGHSSLPGGIAIA